MTLSAASSSHNSAPALGCRAGACVELGSSGATVSRAAHATTRLAIASNFAARNTDEIFETVIVVALILDTVFASIRKYWVE